MAKTTPSTVDRLKFLPAIIEGTSDGALIIDSDGKVLAVNSILADQIGIPREELIGCCLWDVLPEEVAARRRVVYEMAVNSKTSIHYEDDSRPGFIYDTRVHPVLDEQGEVSDVVVFIANITESRQVEKDRLRLRSAIEHAVEAFVITDENLVIQYVNQAVESLTGYTQHESVGKSLDMFYVGKKQRGMLNRIVECLNRGEVWIGKTSNTRKDGQVIHCEKTLSPIRSRHGVIVGFVSVWRDVTQVSDLRRQLHHAQKMEAIGTLAGGIAHDFNNILGPVILHTEMALEMAGDNRMLVDSLEQVLEAGKRARDLVYQILNFSRMRELDEHIPFKVSTILKECVKLLRPSLPSSIRVFENIQTEEDVIIADPAQVHQLLMNLCTNAAQAMEGEEGELRLSIRPMELNEHNFREYPQTEPGSFVEIRVEDTGHGIPAQTMGRIFDPFFTTRKGRMGTGLGLAVVDNIVNRLGGGVKVVSEPGQGTSFSVLIPRQDGLYVESADSCAVNIRARKGERVLVVDDDEAMLRATQQALERLGYHVTTAQSGTEARQLVLEESTRYDAVLTDLTMPDMSGARLAKELREIHATLPIILASGYTESFSPLTLGEIGISRFIMKPFQSEEIGSMLRGLIDERRPGGASRT